MKSFAALAASAAFALAGAAFATTPGQPAPAFSLTDTNGKTVSLADFKGRYVVLEWNNPSCPFVMKHYNSRNMQALQKSQAGDKVAWLAINSTHSGHSEYLPPDKLAAWFKQQNAAPTAILMDSKSEVARAFDAKATPQMIVIDPAGRIIYNGAIDDRRSANPADVEGSRNYVVAALGDAKSGKPVATASTAPYGCTIKYP